jgi:DNA-binding GntR family transcriptional regulator
VLNLDLRGSPARLQLGGAEACHADLVKAIAKSDGRRARAALQADIKRAAAFIESRGVLREERDVNVTPSRTRLRSSG